MKASCTLIRKTDLEILIESNDKDAIKKIIEQKERALKDAMENSEYYKSVNNVEFADNEQSRVNRLTRDIYKLKAI